MNAKQKLIIDERSQGVCEAPNCPTPKFGLQYCHLEPKRMGGRHGKWKGIFDDARNQARLCLHHHHIIDNVVNAPVMRDFLLRFLKKKIDHESWREEYFG
ncbi:MAG: hypothetical protein JW901_05375 [Dehalococcoidia bacterium]|nr:hypothetical protein [Dehalococcoidia bacterium]